MAMSIPDWYDGIGPANFNAHLLTACVEQLLKDIAHSGLIFEWEENAEQDLSLLHPRLSLFLESLQRRSKDEFQRLMYRIDVSESTLRSVLRSTDSVKASSNALATLVLKREMQKVMIREYWSGNRNESPKA